MIEFFVPGKPVGKERARSTRNGNHYTPEKTRSFEALVGAYALQARQKAGIHEPLKEEVALYVALNYSAKGKIPDNSNVLKAIEDGMNKIIYSDDNQIFDGRIFRTRDDVKEIGAFVKICTKQELKTVGKL